ncbi:hypothetical protein RJ639_039025 [Escallonia herrerae]|uniref:BHLH domain-containing protein n=1 Tax=Escallonia herrerae TaxID=1293975 RepID=A0AA88WNU3_9ASTE|nr:hypothetical protein RJ639_039025 [Escallonia herrerae]
MEGDFQPVISAGFAGDVDPFINGMYSTMPFHSLLTLTLQPSPQFTRQASTTADPTPLALYGDKFPANQFHNYCQWSEEIDSRLKVPKNEPPNTDFQGRSTEQFDFLSGSPSFHQLPGLSCLEQVNDEFAITESAPKRLKPFTPPSDGDLIIPQQLLRNFQMSNYGYKPPEIASAAAAVPAERRRRPTVNQVISEKTHSLKKMLPASGGKKMDQATVFEEAYRYIKFLQAQVSVLQSMPGDSSRFATRPPCNAQVVGGLGRLNRQQLLQVLVNSPAAQSKMFSEGCCVFSIEQLILVRQMAERRAAAHEKLQYYPFL